MAESVASSALAEIRAEITAARAELATLRSELAQVRHVLTESQTAQLREANEHLVVAALQAQTGADSARSDLDTLTHASQRDSLTGLPNRALMLDRLESAIARAQRHRMQLAVLFLDLDAFKHINDTRGHVAGDAVLQEVARCLSASVRLSDTVSRHGGDEFLVLLSEVAAASDAARVAAKVLSVLDEPGRFGDPAIRLTVSVGIALFPSDGRDARTLIERADAAMYRAKQSGGNRFEFCAPAVRQ